MIGTNDPTAATPDTEAFKPFIKAVGRGHKLKRDLTYEEAVEAMRLMLQQEATEAQIGAFLIAQRVKGEAVDEIRGFTDVLRNEFIVPIAPRVDGLLDLATPYDGKAKTAQLAPAVALILAEAGVPVVLHGAENVPTKEGVTPGAVLAALRIPTQLEPAAVAHMIETVGIGYLDARQFAPRWHALLPLRRQFGLRTVCNTVEKLLNPANAAYQISGFFHGNYIERIRSTQTGTQRSYIVQGEEGSIEMATGRRTPIYGIVAADDIILEPARVGLSQRERIELPPLAARHTELNRAILAGQTGAAADQAIFTAAAILYLLQAANDVANGMARVQRLVASGAVQQRLERVQRYTPQV